MGEDGAVSLEGAKNRKTIRDRLRRRIDVCRYNMSSLGEDLGLSPGYIYDFMSGRKKTIPEDIWERIAQKLNTTELWLTRGVGPEEAGDANSLTTEPLYESEPDRLTISINAPSKKENRTVFFLALDMTNGAATVCDDRPAAPPYRVKITDPDVYAPNNAYALSLAKKTALRVKIKRLTDDRGKEAVFVTEPLA